MACVLSWLCGLLSGGERALGLPWSRVPVLDCVCLGTAGVLGHWLCVRPRVVRASPYGAWALAVCVGTAAVRAHGLETCARAWYVGTSAVRGHALGADVRSRAVAPNGPRRRCSSCLRLALMPGAERHASGAPGSRSEARAEAVRRHLHAFVRWGMTLSCAPVSGFFCVRTDCVRGHHLCLRTRVVLAHWLCAWARPVYLGTAST